MAKWKRRGLQNHYARVRFPLRPQIRLVCSDFTPKGLGLTYSSLCLQIPPFDTTLPLWRYRICTI